MEILKIDNIRKEFGTLVAVNDVTMSIEKGHVVVETKHRTKNGDIRDVLMSSVPILIQGKYFTQHIYIDITELKRMNDKIKSREAELEEKNTKPGFGRTRGDPHDGE